MVDDNEIVTIPVTSDHHINSTLGLSLPLVELDDGGTYHASRGQHWLWECWLDYWKQIAQLPGRKVGYFNGDLGELDTKRRTVQLITPNKSTIQSHIIDVLEPALDVLDSAYFFRGTMAHTGKSGWLEEAIAKDVTITNRYSKSIASWWHLRGVASGVRTDTAHHANLSGTPWNVPGSAAKVVELALWYYKVEMDQPPPHILIRSHNHKKATAEDGDTRVLFTPAWTTATEYTYRTGKENSLADIGGYAIICQGGKHEVKSFDYKSKESRQVWKLKI